MNPKESNPKSDADKHRAEREQCVRDCVYARLYRLGWLSKTFTSQQIIHAEFTELGISKLRQIHSLFDELGWNAAYLGGEFEVIVQLGKICVSKHGNPN